MRALAFVLALATLSAPWSWGWENHRTITRAALQSYEGWEAAPFESLEAVLPALTVAGSKPKTVKVLCDALKIQCEKVKWDWNPAMIVTGSEVKAPTVLDVLVQAVREPDDGMDQDLNISADQKYMGGSTGPTSQGFRHMYYRGWTPFAPLATFHYPLHEMGEGPERAELFFTLAKQAKAGGHPFWAWRFLGWGLHYVQDLGQPYHANQFASFRILPLLVLVTVGWEPFVIETTRIVSNYHLAFEQYVDAQLDPNNENALLYAFKVPRADENMKVTLEQNAELKVLDGIKLVAATSNALATEVAGAEKDFMGKRLAAPGLKLGDGFRDESGKPKVDFAAIELESSSKDAKKALLDSAVTALSNTGVATRWYIDRFRALDTSK